MLQIDVVILAYTLDNEIWEMNRKAIQSLRNSEPEISFRIVLVESNPDWEQAGFIYDDKVEVLQPKEKFNFNHFNNLGMARGKADWVLFSNNDVVYHPGWCSAMLKVHAENPELLSLCPVDPESEHTPKGTFAKGILFEPGYLVRRNFTGWCFLVKREVFNQTGPFDERFDYYFADDDFTMELRKHHVSNAVVPASRVSHLANITSKKSSLDISQKFKEDQLIFHQKWGSQRGIAWKNRMVKYVLGPLGLKRIIRKIYASR